MYPEGNWQGARQYFLAASSGKRHIPVLIEFSNMHIQVSDGSSQRLSILVETVHTQEMVAVTRTLKPGLYYAPSSLSVPSLVVEQGMGMLAGAFSSHLSIAVLREVSHVARGRTSPLH